MALEKDVVAFVYGKAQASNKYVAMVSTVGPRHQLVAALKRYTLPERSYTLSDH